MRWDKKQTPNRFYIARFASGRGHAENVRKLKYWNKNQAAEEKFPAAPWSHQEEDFMLVSIIGLGLDDAPIAAFCYAHQQQSRRQQSDTFSVIAACAGASAEWMRMAHKRSTVAEAAHVSWREVLVVLAGANLHQDEATCSAFNRNSFFTATSTWWLMVHTRQRKRRRGVFVNRRRGYPITERKYHEAKIILRVFRFNIAIAKLGRGIFTRRTGHSYLWLNNDLLLGSSPVPISSVKCIVL